ncbi:unnamed protein product [Ectocarpus fasciculatus]
MNRFWPEINAAIDAPPVAHNRQLLIASLPAMPLPTRSPLAAAVDFIGAREASYGGQRPTETPREKRAHGRVSAGSPTVSQHFCFREWCEFFKVLVGWACEHENQCLVLIET